jgi:hypothetical protein
MLIYMRQDSHRIGGPGTIVEIDETLFGRRQYSRGRVQTDVWVFSGVERGSGRTFLVPVPSRSTDTLTAVIHWILPGTTIVDSSIGTSMVGPAWGVEVNSGVRVTVEVMLRTS